MSSRSNESRSASMTRSSNRQVSRTESRSQVNRSTSDRQSMSTRSQQGSMRTRGSEASRISSTPQVSRTAPERVGSQSATRSSADRRPGNDRVSPGTTRGGSDRGTVGTVRTGRERPSSQMSGSAINRTTQSAVTPSHMDDNKGGRGGNNGNHGGMGQGGNKNGRGNDRGGLDNNRGRGGNNDHNGRGNNRGGRGNDRGYDNDRGHNGGNHHGYGPSGRHGRTRPYNYDRHPHRDHFSYAHAHHNWSRPLPPPPRPYRPAPLRYYRPVIPAHYRPYYGAPVIDRILGITFGTYFDVSLDYLYTSGYYIDGYQDNIVYLRDVSMLNLLWPDVMLCYDAGRLANAQFVYASTYRDRSRYNRIYHDLSAVYGPPISVESGMATWFGGNTTGYVTLSMGSDYGRYYTTLSIGY